MKMITTMAACAAAMLLGATSVQAQPVQGDGEDCRVAWSHYTGWEPMVLVDGAVADRWSDRYNVNIEITLIADYVESLTQFSVGSYDFVTSTTIDALTIPAAGGVDTTVLVLGDYSDGNDAILVRDATGRFGSVSDLVPGTTVYLVEYSVSDYLFGRALQMHGMDSNDFELVNTSDADIGNLFATAPEGTVVVTWNPIVMTAMDSVPGATSLFSSSRIPEEILDTIITQTDTSEACKMAVTGAWYEAMEMMSGDSAESAIADMADFASGGGVEDATAWFNAQLRTTRMFYEPAESLSVFESEDLMETHEHIRTFAFDRGLLGEYADSADFIGIEFPDGTVLGNENNVRLRFDPTYTILARDGGL